MLILGECIAFRPFDWFSILIIIYLIIFESLHIWCILVVYDVYFTEGWLDPSPWKSH